MAHGQLPEALTILAVPNDGFAIKFERPASDVTAFETSTPHAGADLLDDQGAFEFRDRTDDDHDGTPQRSAGVDALAEAYELDFQAIQLVEHFEEVPGRAGDAVRCPYQDDIEPSAAGIPHQIIQPRAARLRAADLVSKLRDDFVPALSSHLAEVIELGLRMLIDA